VSRLLRLFRINQVFLRYRLDSFALGQPLPWPIALVLAPLRILPAPKQARGIRLRRALEDLGPVFVKFGQLLSTRPDLLPEDICTELSKLQDEVPPFEVDRLKGRVETALGDKISNLFATFEDQPLASASIAQVHAATLPAGDAVVVKVIRPGIEKTIRQDCSLLLTIARLIEKYHPDGRRLRPVEVARDYQSTVLDELNLQREAANTATLRRHFEHSRLLYVPDVYWPYCGKDVMVVERIFGTPVTDIAALRQANTDMRALAERGVEIFFTQVFEHNFFHADMHPGNIFVDTADSAAPRYLAIDCAIIGSLTDRDQYFLARVLIAVFRRDYRQVAELHRLAGWVSADAPLQEVEATIRTVCEPIFQRPLGEISCGHMLVSLFQAARRFDAEVQPSLVLLQKTLLNIEGLGRQLYPELDLWATAHPFLERWLIDRFGPSRVLRQLRRDAPDWLEHLPQVPQLLMRAVDQLNELDRTLKPDTRAPSGTTPRHTRKQRLKWAGGALGVTGLVGLSQLTAGGTDFGQNASTLLIAAGLLLLLVR